MLCFNYIFLLHIYIYIYIYIFKFNSENWFQVVHTALSHIVIVIAPTGPTQLSQLDQRVWLSRAGNGVITTNCEMRLNKKSRNIFGGVFKIKLNSCIVNSIANIMMFFDIHCLVDPIDSHLVNSTSRFNPIL